MRGGRSRRFDCSNEKRAENPATSTALSDHVHQRSSFRIRGPWVT